MLAAFGTNHRKHKHIHRDVIELLQGLLKRLACWAIWVGKHRDDATTVAAHDLDGLIEWQALELNRRQFGNALFGQIPIRFCLVQIANDDVLRTGIGIDHLDAFCRTKSHFKQPSHRCRLDTLDFAAL